FSARFSSFSRTSLSMCCMPSSTPGSAWERPVVSADTSSVYEGGEIAPRASASLARTTLRRLVRKKLALVAIAYLAVFYFAAVFAPWVAPHDPNQQEITV